MKHYDIFANSKVRVIMVINRRYSTRSLSSSLSINRPLMNCNLDWINDIHFG